MKKFLLLLPILIFFIKPVSAQEVTKVGFGPVVPASGESPTTYKWWWETDTEIMWRWNGSAWENEDINEGALGVGAATTSSSQITTNTTGDGGVIIKVLSTGILSESADSINFALASSSFSGTATIANSADTLLNGTTAYGHFQRIGNIVNFTLRFHVGLGSGGGANTVYISPPIASNFTQEASDVIGTASLDAQAQSTANTVKQRSLVFASTSDDKIGVAYDPVASLTFPENRVYISVSGSYIVQ